MKKAAHLLTTQTSTSVLFSRQVFYLGMHPKCFIYPPILSHKILKIYGFNSKFDKSSQILTTNPLTKGLYLYFLIKGILK